MEIEELQESYTEQLNELIDGALNGDISEQEFTQAAEAVVVSMFLLAYLAAGGDANQQEAIAEDRRLTLRSVQLLADDIYSGRYSRQVEDGQVVQTAEQGRERLDARLILWATALLGVYAIGQLKQRPPLPGQEEKRYIWVWTPEKKHCRDCRVLNRRVLTASEWDELSERFGIRTQSQSLECNGFYCGCRFVPTDRPSQGIDSVIAALRAAGGA